MSSNAAPLRFERSLPRSGHAPPASRAAHAGQPNVARARRTGLPSRPDERIAAMSEILRSSVTVPAAWALCGACKSVLWRKRLDRNLRVCEHCGTHAALTAWERLGQLLDPGPLDPLDLAVPGGDPLGFVDVKPYPQRLAEARARTGLAEAVV